MYSQTDMQLVLGLDNQDIDYNGLIIKEMWVDIKGYEGRYLISNIGRVKSIGYGKDKILKQARNKDGYLFVYLSKSTIATYKGVHTLVAKGFVFNELNKPEVNHKNGVIKGADEIGSEAGETVRKALLNAAALPRQIIEAAISGKPNA